MLAGFLSFDMQTFAYNPGFTLVHLTILFVSLLSSSNFSRGMVPMLREVGMKM